LGLNILTNSYTVIAKVAANYEYSVRACNELGCSLLSEFEGVKVNSDFPPLKEIGNTSIVSFNKNLVGSSVYLGDVNTASNWITKAFTVETWAKPSVFESDVSLIGIIQDNGSSEFGWALGTTSWGKFNFALATENSNGLTYLNSKNNSENPTCGSFDENTWHHVVGVYNGAEMQIYINGILCNSSLEQSGKISYPTSGDFVLGMMKDSDEEKTFDGSMSDVRIWDKALTQQEIRKNMSSRLSGQESGLIAYWQLNEASGNIAIDLTGNITGTLNETNWSQSFLPLKDYVPPVPKHTVKPVGWRTQGNQILSPDGVPFIIKAMNWFGFQTPRNVVHGLWEVDYEDQLDQIKALGFNTIRLPYASSILRPEAKVTGYISSGNEGFVENVTPSLEALDIFIDAAAARDLYIILDRHSIVAGEDDPDFWYNDIVTEQQWIRDWEFLAARYISNPNVIGADLHNEPHGDATWGTGQPLTDWRLAAQKSGNAILKINPNWLIIVEGIDWSDHFFDNEDLDTGGADLYPVELNTLNKVVYSPHEYGPDDAETSHRWFVKGTSYQEAKEAWNKTWGYILDKNIAPVLIGEFGGRYVDKTLTTPLKKYPVDSGMTQGDGAIWYEYMVNYIYEKNISFAYWTWTPNSTNSGGILDDNYMVIQDKIDVLDKILAMESNTPNISPIFIPDGGKVNIKTPIEIKTFGSIINYSLLDINGDCNGELIWKNYKQPIYIDKSQRVCAKAKSIDGHESNVVFSDYQYELNNTIIIKKIDLLGTPNIN
jgi:endoglucanase